MAETTTAAVLDVPVVPERLDGLLAESAAAHPARTALVGGGREMDFAELDRRVTAAADAIRALVAGEEGPPRAATVAVASVLHPDFAVAYYATVRAGQVVAVVNPLLREDDLRHVLELSGARAAFVDATVYGRLAAVRDRLPLLRDVVLIGEGAEEAADAASVPTLDALVTGPSGTKPWTPPGAEDVACVQFTSGTTGRPKAVALTHRNLAVNAAQIADAHLLDADSVTVNHLPTFHPMHLNSAVRAAATQVLCTGPDPVDAVTAANDHGATHLYSLPVRLMRLAADPALAGLALRTVERIASGGSALPPMAAGRLTARFGVPVFQGYGLAETSPLTHSDDPDHPVHGSVGRPVAGTECRVVGIESREPLPAGEKGEVQLRGPQVMKGYLGRPEGAGLDADGWLTTGDVGRVDDDGRLFLVDRLKDVFKCDNFLVAPSEVEQLFARHPLVRECVVVDLPDDFSGAVAGALVALHRGAVAPGADPAALLASVVASVNPLMPYYRRVRHAKAVAAVPRSGNGKVQRRVLREELIQHRAEAATPPAAPQADHRPTDERPDMPAPLFTVVNTFTLKDPSGGPEFERRFLRHVEWMRGRDGFDSHQAVRSSGRPDVYVNVGWWRAAEDFQQVMASDVFQAHAAEFHEIVDVSADPSMGVLRVDGRPVEHADEDGLRDVVVEEFTVTGDGAAFEAAFHAYAQKAAAGDGLVHIDLARSLFQREGGYTAVTVWHTARQRAAAQAGPEYAAVLAEADVRVVEATPVTGVRTAHAAKA
ncbi:AMP-binding protein [Streptomyces montanisoli]|uniref:AMP-binding protein n=1 Tax=Streptomyces montanisoli TaxID=2798581 RepID=A0A940MFF2_9ACTN|nr:AMP-binding protein [Streptomyces montanisoli]MBP0460082.1 AMP-binding protein [Streptomyces montanisoli]